VRLKVSGVSSYVLGGEGGEKNQQTVSKWDLQIWEHLVGGRRKGVLISFRGRSDHTWVPHLLGQGEGGNGGSWREKGILNCTAGQTGLGKKMHGCYQKKAQKEKNVREPGDRKEKYDNFKGKKKSGPLL